MSDGTRYKDANGNDSAKRFWGALGMGLFMALVAGLSLTAVIKGMDIPDGVIKLVSTLGYVSGGCLGIGVFENLMVKSK